MSTSKQHTYIESHILRRFNLIKKVGSGAYGHVWKVQQKFTKKIYALKKIFDAFQHATDAQRTYREIEILKQLDHPNIIKLHETVKADNNRDVYLLFEFMEADLHNVIAENILKDVHIRFITYQLAKALKYLHSGKIIHRDLKPSNVLVNSNCTIKLCDFGLVRSLNPGKDQNAILTEGVATRWYRSPQVLLGSKSYSTPADIWSFGCIVYEILSQKPLFNGSCTLDQIQKICCFTGYPTQEDICSLESQISRSMLKQMKIPINSKQGSLLKDISPQYIDLLERILVFNPNKRMTVDQILQHDLVKSFRKVQEEICCTKQISTSIDDNKKFSVDEYRKLIYGTGYSIQKPKGLSSSLGAGSVSPKYQPPQLNKTTITFAPNKFQTPTRSQIFKKYSFDKLRTNNQVNYFQQTSKKMPQKQSIKYIKHSNNIQRSQLTPQQNKEPKNCEVNNAEEVDSPKYLTTQFIQQTSYPSGAQAVKYPYYQKPSFQSNKFHHNSYSHVATMSSITNTPTTSIAGSINHVNPLTTMNWNSINWTPKPVSSPLLVSPSEIKDKVLQFRATKVLGYSKNETLQKTGIMQEAKKFY